MNALQFIKWYGLEDARHIIKENIYCHDHEFTMKALRELVESVDLINYWGGLEEAKDYADFCFFKGREERGNRMKQAIADYESIYGEEGARDE
jgi:hypothetical protein